MKKFLILVILLVVALALVIPQVVLAKENVDKGSLTKKVFIHYKKPNAKPDGTGKPGKPSEGSYTYIARGMRWKTTENYIFNSSSAPSGADVAIATAMATWDDVVAYDIFGSLLIDNDAKVILDNVDNKNVIQFAPLNDPQIIAITYVWGYYNAPPRYREIVEVDMIFNDYYDWGDYSPGGIVVMDVCNIATHEMGHAAGMGDLYDTASELETMYGYSGYADIEKRDLHDGDIAGIKNLYQ